MLVVTFFRDGRQRLSSIFAEGHTQWDEAGQDIVCAAASAILQAAWLGLSEYAGVAVEGERDGEDGRLAMRWPEAARDRDDVRAIVATAELSIAQIAQQFPAFVRAARDQEP